MKATWAIAAILSVALLMAGGCGRPLSKPANTNTKPVSVTVENGSPFPAALAGLWKADLNGWEFVLQPDGSIASAVLSFGRVRVLPGQTTTVLTMGGGQAVFTPGPWVVDYDPANRILTIKIAMKHVQVPMGGTILEGSSTDTFTGTVSLTMDTWQAEWTSFTDYKAETAKGKSTNLSTDKNYGEAVPLVFNKMAN